MSYRSISGEISGSPISRESRKICSDPRSQPKPSKEVTPAAAGLYAKQLDPMTSISDIGAGAGAGAAGTFDSEPGLSKNTASTSFK